MKGDIRCVDYRSQSWLPESMPCIDSFFSGHIGGEIPGMVFIFQSKDSSKGLQQGTTMEYHISYHPL